MRRVKRGEALELKSKIDNIEEVPALHKATNLLLCLVGLLFALSSTLVVGRWALRHSKLSSCYWIMGLSAILFYVVFRTVLFLRASFGISAAAKQESAPQARAELLQKGKSLVVNYFITTMVVGLLLDTVVSILDW